MKDEQLALIGKAIADPNRFRMLRKIADSKDPLTCGCLYDWIGLAPATVSHHLKELEQAGLIHMQRLGKFQLLTFRRDVWTAYLKSLSSL